MGGHSHWKGIKEKKGALDKKRGKLFAKLLRAIEITARQGDPNPDNNPTLADAVQRAKDASVPKDNIERALARGAGEGPEGGTWESVLYEGYGPGGVAVLCDALTNNRNRTSQDLRAIFRKHGGNLAEPGAVRWQFDRRSVTIVAGTAATEDEIMTVALDAGAEDIIAAGDDFEIVADASAHVAVRSALEGVGIAITSSEITQRPQNSVPVDGADARGTLAMMEALEDHDDVQAVYANFDIPESVLAEAG